ncbi:MAG: hypothetical protein Q9216_003793 [Gyalolechia sp. 2 TL-2023]
MWNRILGKSNDLEKNPSTPESRRKSETERSTPRRSESLKSAASSRKTPRFEDGDRGFNPISTSYSSTTRNQYPGTASASIGSSFETAFNDPTRESYLPPGLVRNASLADQIPKSSSDGDRGVALGLSRKSEVQQEDPFDMDSKRDRKERRGTRDRDDIKQERKRSRDKKSRRNSEGRSERGMSIDETAYRENRMSSRAATASNPLERPPPQSSHVQDQFPGQFPAYSATPYRPPLAASEGGPGLAAEYYGDVGQSVADQPGRRIHSPSLIVGAEPHLQAASAVVAPPPEPSASGGVGAAASFFDGSYNTGSDMEDHHGQKPAPTVASSVPQYSSAIPPSTTFTMSASGHASHHSTSEPVIPTLGAAAAGAAAGYYMSNRPSKPERPVHAPSSTAGHSSMAGSMNYQPSTGTHPSYASPARPQANPGKHSSQSANIPYYAAGAAGLAAATYHHNHQDSPTQHQSHSRYYGGNSMAQQYRHRHVHHGPLSKLLDFFKDPDGVAQFEEYTEYIGVCRYCFAPGSSPRDAPRKHHYRRRRSHEKLGSSVRVDKDSRYWSSENESRRRKNKSWIQAGIAGYGLGKMGESLFKQDRDFDDSHSVRSGRVTRSYRRRSSSSSLERKSRTSRGVVDRSTDTLPRRSRSKDRVETGITSDGKLYRKDSHGNIEASTVTTRTSRHGSRSRSRNRRNKMTEAALGAAVGSSVIASTSRRRSRSPNKTFIRPKHGKEAGSSELASVLRLHDSGSRDDHRRLRHSPESKYCKDRKKEKKRRGFFSFSNGSSTSSSSSDLAFEVDPERKSGKGTKPKRKDRGSREADAAMFGLGAAAAALALNQNQRSKHKSELIAVKESKRKGKPSKQEYKSTRSATSSEEDQWESASEGDWSSADSELAYGASLRRRSQESLSSDSSGLDKWGWRWGSKKEAKKPASVRRQSYGVDHVSPAAGTLAERLDTAQVPSDLTRQDSKMTSSSSIPLQYVYPMPTSDPTQYDVARHGSGDQFHQSHINGRPDPVPIQHPQPVAPVSQAVYTSQSPFSHSYSAPIGPSMSTPYTHPSAVPMDRKVPEVVPDQIPGAFPTGSEYFETFMRDSNKDIEPRRRDSSPVTRITDFTSPSTGLQKRKSLKDEPSSVRFDLTKEQEDKDRREERRRRKEDDKRRERRERQEIDGQKTPKHDSPDRRDIIKADERARSHRTSTEELPRVKTESWAAPAAAGVIAAAIGASVAAEGPSKIMRRDKESEKGRDREDRDIEIIVKERHVSSVDADSQEAEENNGSAKGGEAMSIWQAAAKLKRTSSYTDYAAYFTPPELLSKSSDVKRVVGANADNDITVYQVPHVVTVEPSESRGRSASRAYSFPITGEDLEHGKKPLPWSVPQLNLVEPTPPSSRAGSMTRSRSPQPRSPLSGEVPVIDIPLEPLESLADANITFTEPEHVEYAVIEPKEHRQPPVDSPTTDVNISESVPGISSLKNRSIRKELPPEAVYGDDLDFAATVAAGLQDTGFNPSIVIDDLSFRRRDSPPGSEEDSFRRGPTAVVTEITSEPEDPKMPPHGFVEEIPEHHVPGSFDEDEERASRAHAEPREKDLENTVDFDHPDYATTELTGPSDNMDARPRVYEVETVPIEAQDPSNAAFDPVASSGERKASTHEKVVEKVTEPSDNARANPQVFSAEPGSFQASEFRDVTIDPGTEPQRSTSISEEKTYSSPDKVDYPSGEAASIAATAPVSSSNGRGSKSKKKSKRRSVGFEDTPSVISSPASFGDTQDSSAKPDKARKGGIFGLFSKSTENLSESKGSQGIPVEANLEDFEEPKKRSKKSKNRKSTLDDEVEAAAEAEPSVPQETEAQDDWSTSKKSKRGKDKRRSSEEATVRDSGRITQDLPAQVIAPASPGHAPLPSSSEMLTDLEDPNVDRRSNKSEAIRGVDSLEDLPRAQRDQEPSFLGERPEKPPLPDLPDASEDPGGQLERFDVFEKDVPLESHSESPAKVDKQKWRLSDDRSVSYSSPSPTAVPLRPLRFGRRPSSPGLTKSLPSTPQPPTAADPPFTPRRRERPHSTEFKSNEFRPIWLLEKHGSRQEPAPQESYPSLPSSHSTSRASSVHEADNLDQASKFNNYQFTPGHRGLAIDTSHYEPESELLDSQQATPTAATFQSIFKEDGGSAEETGQESERPRMELIDVIPPADAYVDPIIETDQDKRLLHGVDELLPQHRSNSPFGYDTVAASNFSEQPDIGDPLSEREGRKDGSSVAAMIKDAALGAFIGGSAAALWKSTSKHDKHLEQSLDHDELERNVKNEDDLDAQPAPTVSGRPTAEEMRLLQEQDAQDAVDSWFAPVQPKRTKNKKGKKRGESLEVFEPPATTDLSRQASSQQQTADLGGVEQAATGDKTRSFTDEAVLTTEPKEAVDAPQSQNLREEIDREAAGADWQTALATRKDPKAKKKKNKKKGADSRDNKTVLLDEVTAEQPSNLPTASERGLETEDSIVKDTPAAYHDDMERPSTMPIDAKTSPEAEISSTTVASKELPTFVKKNNRQSSYSETTETVIPEEPFGAQLAEEPKALVMDVPTGSSNIPVVPIAEDLGLPSSSSDTVSYQPLRPEDIRSEAPNDGVLPAENPLSSVSEQESNQTVEPRENLHETSPKSSLGSPAAGVLRGHHAYEGEAAPTAEPTGSDQLPTQGSETASLQAQLLPANVPLPLSDDLDLMQPPPDSPIIQPIDAALTGESSRVLTREELEASDQKKEPVVVHSNSILSSPSLDSGNDKALSGSDVALTIPTKVISELNLPERAMKDQPAESADVEEVVSAQEPPEDEWPTFTPKKSKKEKKGRKSISNEAKSEQDIVELRKPSAEETANRTSNDISPVQGLPLEQALYERNSSEPQRSEVQGFGQFNDRDETVESIAKLSSEGIEEDVDLPTATKKKKKAKKGKKVQFDELEGPPPQQSEASAARELPSATTSTAKDVEDLIQAEAERDNVTGNFSAPQETSTRPQPLGIVSGDMATASGEQPEMESFLKPKKPYEQDGEAESFNDPSKDLDSTPSLPQSDTLAAAVDRRSGDPDPALFDEYGRPSEEGATASTSTAAEIQDLLAGAKEQEALPATSQDPTDGSAQPTEVDDFARAPSKKKKKGRKSKSADEAVTATEQVPEEFIKGEVSMPGGTSATEPAEESSLKKSEKDEKIKRKSLSRSASDIHEEPQSTPLQGEPKEEMAVSNDAPSIFEKPHQPSPFEISTTPEVANREVSFDPVATDEPRTSIEATPEATIEETETTAEVPSFMEEHGEMPGVVLPTLLDIVRSESSTVGSDHPMPVPPVEKTPEIPTAGPDKAITFPLETEDTTTPVAEAPEAVSRSSVTDDRPHDEEPPVSLASANIVSPSDHEAVGQPTKDEVADEATAPVPDDDAAFQPPMSSKNKKKAKKAKASQLEGEFPILEPERVSHANEIVPDPTIGPTSEVAFEVPTKTKKDKKKSKKAKALDWLEGEALSSPSKPSELAESGVEEHGHETALPEAIPLEPEAVKNEETSTGTTVNEATEGHAEKVEASALERIPPTLSDEQVTGPGENRTVMIPALETSSEPINEEHSAVASDSLHKSTDLAWDGASPEKTFRAVESGESAIGEPVNSVTEDSPTGPGEFFKSKKDKKKAKKSKSETLEDNFPTTSTGFGRPQQETTEMTGEQSAETIVEDNLKTAEEPLKSKKDKKKAKKAKLSAWEEEEPVTPSAVLSAEPESIDQQSMNAAEAQDEEMVRNLPDEQGTSRKGKKKSKKSRSATWDEEPSIAPSRDETDKQPTGAMEEDTITPQPEGVDAAKVDKDAEVADIQTVSKKGKKKGKKSKFVAWDEEPSAPSPSGEKEQSPADSQAQPAESGFEKQPIGNEESKGDVEVSATMPEKKKDKKKAKKSKALAWEEGPGSSVPQGADTSEISRDLADQSEELIPPPGPATLQGKDESVPNDDVESKLNLGPMVNDESHAQLSTTPTRSEEAVTVQEVTPLPAEETKADGEESTAMMLNPRLEPASIFPTDNVEITEASVQALTEDIEIPGGDSSMVNEDDGTKLELETAVPLPFKQHTEDHPDALVQPSDMHSEPVPAPTIDDALENTEQVIPPTSCEDVKDTSPVPVAATAERSTHPDVDFPNSSLTPASMMDSGSEPTSFAKDITPEIVGQGVPIQSDENVRLDSPVPTQTPMSPDLSTTRAGPDTVRSGEESSQPYSQEPIPEMNVVAMVAEQPAASVLAPEAESVDFAEKPSSTSTKDKKAKKTKKAKEVTEWVDKALEDSALNIEMPSTKLEPESGVVDRGAVQEPALPAESEPTKPEAIDDLLSTSQKEKKKAKKNKKSFAFDEEPSESITPAELEPPTEISSEKPVILGELGTTEDADEIGVLSKKDKKKAKKAKKEQSWEDEASTNITPAEPDPLLESITKAAGETVLRAEPEVTESHEEFPEAGKKDKKKAKKSKRSSAIDEEPFGTATPTSTVEEADVLDQALEKPSMSAEPPVAEAVDDIISSSKKDKKKAKKGKRHSTFDEESAEPPLPKNQDRSTEAFSKTEEGMLQPEDPSAVVDETPAMDKKEREKGKKGKKAFAVDDDEPFGSATPAEPDPVPEVIEEGLSPTEVRTAGIVDDAPTVSNKDKKKAKKSKKAATFEDDQPSATMAPVESDRGIEVLDQTAEELPLSTEVGALEASENTPSTSKKEKKKAKKGKKTLAWENEAPEVAPTVEEAAPAADEPQAPDSALPWIDEPDRSQRTDAAISQEVSQYPATLTDKAVVGDETLLETEPDLPASSKKSKKEKKKAKKGQAYSWDEDDMAREPPTDEFTVEAIPPPVETKVAQFEEDADKEETADDREQADPAVVHADVEQIPEVEPPVSPIVVEHELAPRHQDPAAIVDILERSGPESPLMTDQAHDRTETVASPMLESSVPPQTSIDETSVNQPFSDQPSVDVKQGDNENIALPISQDVPTGQDDEFSSFVTTKKSKKGKKSKKQPIAWEDDTTTPSETIPEPSRALNNESAQARPEMAAWPTEVRLNQREGYAQAQEQLVPDPAIVDVLSPVPEPLEPPLVVDERSDYFGRSPNHEEPLQAEPFNDGASVTSTARAPAEAYEDSYPEAESSNLRDETPLTAAEPEIALKQDEQVASTDKPLDSRNVIAEPADEFEGFTSKKKDKKSKRKQKKQVVDDVMWEFPSMNPPGPPPGPPPEAEQMIAEQSTTTQKSILNEEKYTDSSAAPISKQEKEAEPGLAMQEDLSRETGSRGQQDIPFTADGQAKIESVPTVPEEPRFEQAAEDDWGSVPKKGKKGKKSKKVKEAAQDFVLSPPQPTNAKEPEGPESLDDRRSEGNDPEPFRQSEYQLTDGQPEATATAGAREAIATAAALGAGVMAAEQLGRKESKKGKKNKKSRQASSKWDEQEQEPQPIITPTNQDVDQKIQSGKSTPERRRSPIQAWHQYISPSQSPKQSELYEVEGYRTTSARSTRKRRSHDEQRSQASTLERQSPIEAWHQNSTPQHSPHRSETYSHEPEQAGIVSEQPASKGINRDSAVHVSDSPLVPDSSPIHRVMRDSGYPDTEASPILEMGSQHQERPQEDVQDSRYVADTAHDTLGLHDKSEAMDPLGISTTGSDQGRQRASRTPPKWGSDPEDVNLPRHAMQPTRSFDDLREPSPVSSTTKDRSSVLFESSPSTREEQASQEQRRRSSHYPESPVTHGYAQGGKDDGQSPRPAARSLNPPREDNSAIVNARAESLAALSGLRQADQDQQRPSLFGGPIGVSSDGNFPETALAPDASTQRRLNTITEYSPEESPLHKKNRELSDVGSPDRGVKTARRSGTPQAIQKRRASPPSQANDEDKHHADLERSRSRSREQRPSSHQSNMSSLVSSQPKQREYERRSLSGASNGSIESINAIIRTPPDQMRSTSGMSNRSSGTPPLRRSDRSISGDLRGANRKSGAKKRAKQSEPESEITAVPPSSTPHDSAHVGGKGRVKDMANVFEGYGDSHRSPISPTRPPSMRRRQSMQVLELESKLDQLVAENRSLHDARQRAERNLEDAARDRGQEVDSYRDGIETRDTWLRQKDVEISNLNQTLESLQGQVAQLTEVNQGLHATSRELGDHQERYGQLEEEHADTHQRWQQSTRELEALRGQHAQLSAGMEDIVRHEVNTAVEQKNVELRRLSDELDAAKQQIRTLQQQILASRRSDDSIIPDRDEDYFDAQCQSLCKHVQQWVLRFSKFSDNRACYLASEIRDEKIVDRMENAILDGSDPDDYLADRIKRRDVFMSMVMTMTWEFIFTRYLFGADREQRQKLKSLEKQLSESSNVTMSAVHKWRAITLALLSKREQFVNQRSQDTEAVMHTIYDALVTILPPPSHLVPQVQQSLRKVLASAVDLSVEMRTQRAEYVMLPPLQPEYDTNGDLARKVYFNAALMNERSGMAGVSNEELEASQAVVRMVLFPLVVKKGGGGDGDDGEEEIVVCPAQVLVAAEEEEEEERGKGKRVMDVSASERGGGSDVGMVGNMF